MERAKLPGHPPPLMECEGFLLDIEVVDRFNRDGQECPSYVRYAGTESRKERKKTAARPKLGQTAADVTTRPFFIE